MSKKSKTGIAQLDMFASIRKPMIPVGRIHTTKLGKKGYDRKENRRMERDW